VARVEQRRGIVLDAELDALRDDLAGQLRRDAEAELYARGHAASADEVAVLHYPRFHVGGTHQREEVGEGPVGGRPAAPQEARRAEHEGAGAHGRHVLRPAGLVAHEFDRLPVSQDVGDADAAARHTDQVKYALARRSSPPSRVALICAPGTGIDRWVRPGRSRVSGASAGRAGTADPIGWRSVDVAKSNKEPLQPCGSSRSGDPAFAVQSAEVARVALVAGCRSVGLAAGPDRVADPDVGLDLTAPPDPSYGRREESRRDDTENGPCQLRLR